MKYELLHESHGVEEELAMKYDAPTFDDYKADSSCTDGLSELQKLVHTLLYAIHVGGDKPRCIIINRAKALDLLEELGEIPKEIEGVPLVFDEKALPRQAWLG